MTTKILFIVSFLFQILPAQHLFHPLRAESTNGITRKPISTAAFPETLKVLAIRVQFQQDNDTRTSGDGRFDLSLTNERMIDSPPHDSAYFADHFKFAQNYYSKASNGKQNIVTTVLGKVITLKKQMKDYAPVNDNLPLAQMIEEAWHAADSLNPGFPFQQYSMFTIFHAGVGKDIDLRSSLGFDPTPLDIPSLYFGLSSLQKLLGNSFQGFQLSNSLFKITNSVVLPETEVRKIPSVAGDFVLKLSINGLLIASIGSHLGLPDLFETKTGKTAIGRYGLMDGQSIFSYAGICPPEPSAWEKIYLGWTTPIEVYGNKNLSIPAVGLFSTGNDTIYRIPISAKEYYLVENRNRDAKNNYHSISMKWNNQIIQKTFNKDEEYFTNTNIDSVYGVVIDIDELDWSLPGLINPYNDYKGGILIWHIDETIIEKNIASNTINADPKKRGIDLEEADGSQDLGQSYDFGNPGSGSEDGSPIDYWFKGNIFPNYLNEFSERSNPNSLSNTFAKSHVTLKNFSLTSPRMTFEVNVGDADIQLVKVIKRKNLKFNNSDAPISADLNGDGKQELIYTSGDSIYVLKDDLTPYLNNTTGLFYPKGGKFQPAYATSQLFPSSIKYFLSGVSDSTIYLFSGLDSNNDGIADTVRVTKAKSKFTTPAMTLYNSVVPWVTFIAGTERGYQVSISNVGPSGAPSELTLRNSLLYLSKTPIISSGSSPQYRSVEISESKINIIGSNEWEFFGNKILSASLARIENGTVDSNGVYGAVVFDNNSFSLINLSSQQVSNYPLKGITGALSFADIDMNGQIDVLLGSEFGLHAFNRAGVLIENFPQKTLDAGSVIGSPIVVKLTGSNEIAILFGSSNGQLYAYTSKGKMINGFPLQTGGIVSSPVLWGDKLVVASTDTSVYVWKTGNLFDTSKILWGNFLADNYHSNFIENTSTRIQKSTELLPKKFAYNWPNPVYSGSTNIRYFLGKSGTVKIKIVNLAGELVEELNGTSYAGMDNEVQWNISKIQSGIYFAQITANGIGEEQSQIIKIAVVK